MSSAKTLNESDVTGSIICHNIPEEEGVYLVTDKNGGVLYVGRTNRLRRRIAYLEANAGTHTASGKLLAFQSSGQDAIVHFIVCKNYQEREKELISKYNPPWNTLAK